ncbi:Fic family protein [Paenibacillus albicereus]|uniref:Fic family protein n=1 Tax=Paenibacillus albicereus TaxID=2726185 RepID=A0A6H2GST6_9BACL|nr:Fic family protein [Paenibacillus albicereus]QJC50455.1 Fic family protein [Paenibacillus albicereus]
MFHPRFQTTIRMLNSLLEIQRSSVIVEQLPMPVDILEQLQKEAKETTVLLSTRIEGNELDDDKKRAVFYKHSDIEKEQEVYNLMKALEFLDDAESRELPITEEWVKKLHAIIKISRGGRPRLSEYREQQVVVGRRNEAGFYMAPEPSDVPVLMEDYVAWLNSPETHKLPAPIRAGIAMWQFLTIHPYMDGNGRTARMIATYILRRGQFGLKKIFVLEKFYDRNLSDYYQALQMGLPHNYYFGRHDADVTQWLEYFMEGLAEVFTQAAEIVQEKNKELLHVEPEPIRRLDMDQRKVYRQLIFKQEEVSVSEIMTLLDMRDRTAREKVKQWIASGFLQPRDPNAQRVRTVILTETYEELAKEIRENPKQHSYMLTKGEA